MRPARLLCGLVGTLVAASSPVQSQVTAGQATRDADALIRTVRHAADRYQDRAVALREGYRPLGPEAPGMGQHWVHVGRAMATTVDPTRPAVLTYVDVLGAPRLVGAGLLVTLDQDTPLPAWPEGQWHTHNGDLDDEGLGLTITAPTSRGPQVAILHVWALQPNPDGPFATNNWSLPFTRAGYVPPERAAPDAARAIALLTVGMPYYLAQLDRAGALPDSARTQVEAAMGHARALVAEITAAAAQGDAPRTVPKDMLEGLTRVWRDLLLSLDRLLPHPVSRLLDGHGKH